jgi:hypothetical protein
VKPVNILIAADADALQRFAADELRAYLHKLFGISVEIRSERPEEPHICFLLGQIDDAHIQQAGSQLPALSDQGILIRRCNADTLILAGGSSSAVAWAMYELVEQYGVTYLLHGDVYPESPGPFHLPKIDLVLEPTLRLRSWRQFNDLPTGPGLWSLAQQESFIRQIFKQKFNGIYLCLWPHHPFVDFSVGGIQRQTACLLFGQKIPIDADNIGRQHLPDAPFLDNPDFLGAETYEEKLASGRRLLEGILRQARFLQMRTSVHFQPLEFPAEFRPLLQQPTEESIQLGGLTCTELGDLTNPGHTSLIEAGFRAHLEQWGAVDEFHLSLPEHPHADRQFRQCWTELDEKYHLEEAHPLDDLLAIGARNYLIPGGLERAEREFKSSISMLHFFDHFFAGNDLLRQAEDRNISVHLNLGGNSEPLFPILDRLLWPGAGISTSMGYTASRAVRALRSMESLDATKIPAALVLTLQDDNVGSLPQVATRSLHQLLQELSQRGWRGFLTRHWPIGDLDPPTTLLARYPWRSTFTPDDAYEFHFGRVCGPDSVPTLNRAISLLEDATLILDLDFLSLFFPVLGIMCRTLETDAPMPEGLFHVRALYEEAGRLLDRAESSITSSSGQAELAYWQSRIDFTIQALIEKERIHEGGMKVHAARRASDGEAKETYLREAEESYQRAVEAGESALRATSSQIRDDSDRATLAAYYHFFVREVREKAAELLAGAEGVSAHVDPM